MQIDAKDIEGIKWAQQRISVLEAALQKIIAGPAGDHDHESGCLFEQFACGIAYEALQKREQK